jgi:predicted RND superfamily exporter protein
MNRQYIGNIFSAGRCLIILSTSLLGIFFTTQLFTKLAFKEGKSNNIEKNGKIRKNCL